MMITKSHCRFQGFVYLGGQSHHVSMKLESKRSIFISVPDTFEIERWTDRLKLERKCIQTQTHSDTHTHTDIFRFHGKVLVGVRRVKPLKNFDLSTSGGQINSLK